MPNHLASETSPYLHQHADNPVDWWPWCEQALALARAQDKPILLSIGYSACHWCHVMAHESFEDEATAQVMNALFVNIKIDREERPDLDKIYQLAHQALTRRGGGWPLTVFLAPDDHTPFYAGMYFPKEARYGMPPFRHILEQVRGFWDQRRSEVHQQNAVLRDFLQKNGIDDADAGAITDAPIAAALASIRHNFDAVHGGHLGAPKFPHCAEMELLLDLADGQASPQPSPASGRGGDIGMVELTLTRIANGGIHDQIGGGFCRYSVDERWEIPHFEKMLYDNAQLLPLYARLGKDAHAAIPASLIEWLGREMTAPGDAFYSALDADSEHEEGKFYVWQRDEARALLNDDEFAVADRHWGFDRPANFEHAAWNPIVAVAIEDVAGTLNISLPQASARLASAREKLFAARAPRVRPGLDDKILTSWNALMISGLARSSRLLEDPKLAVLAGNALQFLHKHVWVDGRLFASWKQDQARFPAYLDDHAFLLDAIIEVLQNDWNPDYLTWARQLADALLDRFDDRERGGFYFTANDHEALIQRPKSWADEAIPSGNGVAARSLLRLGHLLGDTRYLDAAERTLRAASSTMQQIPQGCASLMRALNDFLHPRTHVVIRVGDNAESFAWREALCKLDRRSADTYFIHAEVNDLPGVLDAQKYQKGGVAYVCNGTRCLPPILHPDALVLNGT